MLSGEGLVWFGGLFGAILAVVVVTLVSKQRLAAIMDSGRYRGVHGLRLRPDGVLSAGATTMAIPTDLPWGMSFPKGLPPTTGAGASHPALRDRRPPWSSSRFSCG